MIDLIAMYASLLDQAAALLSSTRSEPHSRIGGFTHTIAVSADDLEAVTAWFELGFGVDQVKGIQPVHAIKAPAGAQVREAGLADVDALVDLAIDLTRFHAESPMLRPALSDHDFVRKGFIDGIEDDGSVVVVAEADGALGGFLQLNSDAHYLRATTIGIASAAPRQRHRGHGTAMLACAMDWPARLGYEYCAVEWTSSNPTSDPFWRSHGFQPIQYRPTRRLDPRIAPADASLSHNYLCPLDI